VKTVLLGVYVALVAIGAMFSLVRSQRGLEYAAQRALPRDHRVVASDLRAPDLTWVLAPGLRSKADYVDRYLDRSVSAGHPVKHEYLRERPMPVAVRGTEAYAWLLRETEEPWAQILDVGWAVDLCADDCPVMAAPVLALDCANASTGVCVVVLQLTPDQRKRLLAFPGKQRLNITVSSVELRERR
jgi:hypothetical protein